jgi:hypothetical protein
MDTDTIIGQFHDTVLRFINEALGSILSDGSFGDLLVTVAFSCYVINIFAQIVKSEGKIDLKNLFKVTFVYMPITLAVLKPLPFLRPSSGGEVALKTSGGSTLDYYVFKLVESAAKSASETLAKTNEKSLKKVKASESKEVLKSSTHSSVSSLEGASFAMRRTLEFFTYVDTECEIIVDKFNIASTPTNRAAIKKCYTDSKAKFFSTGAINTSIYAACDGKFDPTGTFSTFSNMTCRLDKTFTYSAVVYYGTEFLLFVRDMVFSVINLVFLVLVSVGFTFFKIIIAFLPLGSTVGAVTGSYKSLLALAVFPMVRQIFALIGITLTVAISNAALEAFGTAYMQGDSNFTSVTIVAGMGSLAVAFLQILLIVKALSASEALVNLNLTAIQKTIESSASSSLPLLIGGASALPVIGAPIASSLGTAAAGLATKKAAETGLQAVGGAARGAISRGGGGNSGGGGSNFASSGAGQAQNNFQSSTPPPMDRFAPQSAGAPDQSSQFSSQPPQKKMTLSPEQRAQALGAGPKVDVTAEKKALKRQTIKQEAVGLARGVGGVISAGAALGAGALKSAATGDAGAFMTAAKQTKGRLGNGFAEAFGATRNMYRGRKDIDNDRFLQDFEARSGEEAQLQEYNDLEYGGKESMAAKGADVSRLTEMETETQTQITGGERKLARMLEAGQQDTEAYRGLDEKVKIQKDETSSILAQKKRIEKSLDDEKKLMETLKAVEGNFSRFKHPIRGVQMGKNASLDQHKNLVAMTTTKKINNKALVDRIKAINSRYSEDEIGSVKKGISKNSSKRRIEVVRI